MPRWPLRHPSSPDRPPCLCPLPRQVEKGAKQKAKQKAKQQGGDTAGAAAEAPRQWNDYTVRFEFPEPTELPPPLLQLIDARCAGVNSWVGGVARVCVLGWGWVGGLGRFWWGLGARSALECGMWRTATPCLPPLQYCSLLPCITCKHRESTCLQAAASTAS